MLARNAALNTAAALPGTGATNKFPTEFGASAAAWPNPHFIFTDSPMATTDISTYATTAATKSLGALIQVPFYVLPVAVAYNPVYGRTSNPYDLTRSPGGSRCGSARSRHSTAFICAARIWSMSCTKRYFAK